MKRILKALFKTILFILGIVLFIFLGIKFPYLLFILVIISLGIYIFSVFYDDM